MLRVPPFWHIVLPGEEFRPAPGVQPLLLSQGRGWGDGSHATTRLCLQLIAFLHPKSRNWRMLDFGSGSGLLAIAGSRLGAKVEAVEIDPDGISHGKRNMELNQVSSNVHWSDSLNESHGPFDLIVANILAPVLLENARDLCARLRPEGVMILSGLVSTDLPALKVRFGQSLKGEPKSYRSGEWNALVWAPSSAPASVRT